MKTCCQIQPISFNAIPGHKMLKEVNKEFSGDKAKLDKFKKVFENVYEQQTCKNTVIDIDKRGNLIYYNNCFPNIKYCYKTSGSNNLALSEKMINECPKTIARGEHAYFHHVIAKLLKTGSSIEELRQKANEENLGKPFINLLSTAERILKENPKSGLTELDFNIMDMKIAEEKMKNFKGDFFDMIKELSS